MEHMKSEGCMWSLTPADHSGIRPYASIISNFIITIRLQITCVGTKVYKQAHKQVYEKL